MANPRRESPHLRGRPFGHATPVTGTTITAGMQNQCSHTGSKYWWILLEIVRKSEGQRDCEARRWPRHGLSRLKSHSTVLRCLRSRRRKQVGDQRLCEVPFFVSCS